MPTDEEYRAAAQTEHCQEFDEIDSDAKVIRIVDEELDERPERGAWVQAWVYVHIEDVKGA